jgi:endoglucanase
MALPKPARAFAPRAFALCLLTLSLAPLLSAANPDAAATSPAAYIRVSQVGYEAGYEAGHEAAHGTPFRAYLMSTASESGATFAVLNSAGATAFRGKVGALLGTWSNSKKLTYDVYAVDFTAPAGDTYSIAVTGPIAASSPVFAVDTPATLYPALLLNTLFFYETQRDGANYIPNALRTAPGHTNDKNASVFNTPPLDDNDQVDNVPPAQPLVSAGLPAIDASGGWWDAGDYMKYVETISYTAALMQIGVRDFPAQMGANAPVSPPAPPASISYAGNSGAGAPTSSDFTAEAQFGVDWLLKMWDDTTKTLYYQVDNSQDYDYYGFGTPTSAAPDCGGTYSTPDCLIAEYDIWTLPQKADHYRQSGDSEPCDPLTTIYICDRPVFPAGPAGAPISPNLAGRMTADFALCYQLNRTAHPAVAKQCLTNAEDIFALADTTYTDPAPSVGSGSCNTCLLTIIPFDGYPESVWEDDMELGATELYFALQTAAANNDIPKTLADKNPDDYLRQAAQYARNYVTNIYDKGYADTLNLYDVSGLAHYELYRALQLAGNPADLAISQSGIRQQLLNQVGDAITRAGTDAWGFGAAWAGDTTSHGAGVSVMASEAFALTGSPSYDTYAQRWLANILGANAWGASFIVGDGSTFPNCIQDQVANIAGSLEGSTGGTPVLWGAATEGPDYSASSGHVSGMKSCPADKVDTYAIFNGNDGAYNKAARSVFKDDVQSYTTTEPGIDLTSTSFLMWSWRLSPHPSF